jgi:hypothetical protein
VSVFGKLAMPKYREDYWRMTWTVKVTNGSIPIPPGVELTEGAEVQLIVPDQMSGPSFAERYAAFVGAARDLPADLAANLDHYVHGHSKK